MSDPWRVLDDPTASPARADAEAGPHDRDDPRRVAGLATWLTARAALDGSTALPVAVVGRALRAYGIDDVVRGVELAERMNRLTSLADEGAVALPEVDAAEQSIAHDVVRLLGGPTPSLRCAVGGEGDAHRLRLGDAAQLLQAAPADQPLVLTGDPDALDPPGPGHPFRDLVASGLVPVDLVPPPDAGAGSPLGQLITAVRGGELPVVPADQRQVVVVPCADADEVVMRMVQLVTSSIPRAFGDGEILVLTVREDGAAGAEALPAALTGSAAQVETVHAAVGRRSATVVLVLPAEASGSLSRALLVSALTVAEVHVSIVHQAGPALAEAVSRVPHRPRRTRLPRLLRTTLGAWQHEQ